MSGKSGTAYRLANMIPIVKDIGGSIMRVLVRNAMQPNTERSLKKTAIQIGYMVMEILLY